MYVVEVSEDELKELLHYLCFELYIKPHTCCCNTGAVLSTHCRCNMMELLIIFNRSKKVRKKAWKSEYEEKSNCLSFLPLPLPCHHITE